MFKKYRGNGKIIEAWIYSEETKFEFINTFRKFKIHHYSLLIVFTHTGNVKPKEGDMFFIDDEDLLWCIAESLHSQLLEEIK